MELSSSVSHLSPVIDLSSASVKTVSNRIENARGQENRYGRRNQLIEFYPVYSFSLSTTTPGVTYQNNQSIKGKTSAANGTIAKVDGNQIWVKVKTKQGFAVGEEVELTQYASTESAPTISVGSNPSLITPIINRLQLSLLLENQLQLLLAIQSSPRFLKRMTIELLASLLFGIEQPEY